MTTYPNCKINLGLHIVGKRADGYHNLETLFLPVHDLHDTLIIEKSDTLQMQQDGIVLDNAPEDNLCVKAWKLLHDEFGLAPVHIILKKNIPFGAGLGGGSSDAAFTLKMLNEMFTLGLSESDLERCAAKLGADCAFFIRNQFAYATGIGDILQPIPVSILDSHFSIQIEIPEGEHVSTKEAYAGLNHDLFGTTRPDLREAVKRPIEEWRNLIVNDFEASIFPAHPAIAELKEDMYRRGALYASMTGSGAAVFGIFKNEKFGGLK